jgi:hypothetical protein
MQAMAAESSGYAGEFRCATFSAIKLPNTPGWSEGAASLDFRTASQRVLDVTHANWQNQ